MGLSSDGSLIPVIAERYTVSEDGEVYTFTLREGVVFSDGSALTADDVVFTIEKAQDPALKSPQFANWSGIKAVALDAKIVEFTLPKPYAPFLENTTVGILPAHIWRGVGVEQFPFSTFAIEPVGAGPYVVSKVTRNGSGLITNYTLQANPRYVLGEPYISTIRFVFFPQETDLEKALLAGVVDSAYGIPSADALTTPYARVFGVFFNANENAVFARLEVRKALSLAIDRGVITHDVLGGYATSILGPVPPGSGIEVTPVPQFVDPASEARAILQAAGWTYTEEDKTWKNSAAKLSFSTLTIKTSNVPELKAVGGAVKTAWEKLGIAVEVELYEPGDLNQNIIRPRKYDALLFGMVIGRGADLFPFWDSGERNDPGLNIAMYTNKVVDSLLEHSREESDPVKRLSDLQKIEDEIAAEFPAAFTHAPEFVYVIPDDLRGVTLPQITTPSDRFAGVATWHVRTDKVWPFFAQGY